MKKSVSGSDLGKKHLTNRVWGCSKRHPIDKYHMFREVCWDALGSFWEAFGVALAHFGHQMALQWRFFEGLKF